MAEHQRVNQCLAVNRPGNRLAHPRIAERLALVVQTDVQELAAGVVAQLHPPLPLHLPHLVREQCVVHVDAAVDQLRQSGRGFRYNSEYHTVEVRATAQRLWELLVRLEDELLPCLPGDEAERSASHGLTVERSLRQLSGGYILEQMSG